MLEKFKILMIEDEDMLRSTLQEDLETEGFEVVGVNSGEAAFEWMRENRPNVIVTDLIMPSMDGFQVIEGVKENLHLQHIPVVVLTNQGKEEDLQKAMKLGAKDFLIKSNMSLSEIVAKIKDVCQNAG